MGVDELTFDFGTHVTNVSVQTVRTLPEETLRGFSHSQLHVYLVIHEGDEEKEIPLDHIQPSIGYWRIEGLRAYANPDEWFPNWSGPKLWETKFGSGIEGSVMSQSFSYDSSGYYNIRDIIMWKPVGDRGLLRNRLYLSVDVRTGAIIAPDSDYIARGAAVNEYLAEETPAVA